MNMGDLVEAFRKAMVEVLVPEIRDVRKEIAELRAEMNDRFAKMDERFAKMDERMSRMETQQVEIRGDIKMILTKLDVVERVSRLEASMELLLRKAG